MALNNNVYTHDSAFLNEQFCSEKCAKEHWVKVYISDTYLGII